MVKKISLILFSSIFLFLSVLGGAYTATLTHGGVEVNEMDEIEEAPPSGIINVFVMGCDVGTLSDTMMIVSLDKSDSEVNILSIPRDTRVNFGSYHQKINSAIGVGMTEVRRGNINEPEDYVIRKIKELTGLPIHYFVTVRVDGFRSIIDALGGVEYDVPDVEGGGRGMNYNDPVQNLNIALKPGRQVLNGKAAEGLVRYRSGYPEADKKRQEVQTEFLKAVAEQKLKPQYISAAPQLFEEIQKNVKTNYTLADLTKHLPIIMNIKPENITQHRLPGTDQYFGGLWWFIPDAKGINQLMQETFIYDPNRVKEPEVIEEPLENTVPQE